MLKSKSTSVRRNRDAMKNYSLAHKIKFSHFHIHTSTYPHIRTFSYLRSKWIAAMYFDRKNLSNDELLALYKQLLLPRLIEEKMLVLLRQGK
jgi:hypothetical protein